MKKIYLTIASIVFLVFANSCNEDILDKTPLDRLSPATFYTNESEVKMALMGVYNALIQAETPIHWYQFDFMSDDAYCHHAWQGSLEFGAWQQNSSSWAAYAKWARDYMLIVRANKFIANAEASSVDKSVVVPMVAEARFLRGYAYADLTHYYGDVPLILKEQTLSEAKVSRTEKKVVLDSIMSDFDYAINHLPLSYASSEVGRATKGAALAYKARTYLYNQEWSKAAEAAKAVMDLTNSNAPLYSLYGDYKGLFEEANENNSEVIFDIQYIKNTSAQPWPSSALSFGEWPTPNVTISIIDSYNMINGLSITDANSGYNAQDPYKNRDPRLAASIALPGSKMGSSRVMIPATDEVPTGVRPRKYADFDNTDRGNCGINTILMRYADILLMRAEALIESGSTSQEVYDLIDQVRNRVNMPSIESVEGTGLNQTQLRQILRHERRVEFFMEGLRYADILRWKDESLIHDVYGYNTSKLSDPSSPATWYFETARVATRAFDSKKGWLWPIPQDDIQNNENLVQNPGY